MNVSKKKVVTSAVIVSPPRDMWSPIQAIRSKHDKAYVRWMPHINISYPFVPANEFSAIVAPFTAGLAKLQPFTVTFDSFDFFEHGPRSCTLFLKPRTEPPSALQDLQAAIQKVFPFCDDLTKKSDDGLFHAHLTVGQFKGQRETLKFKSEFEKNWRPITFEVKEVYVISRNGDTPFEVRHTIPFGQTSPSTSVSQPQQQRQPQAASPARNAREPRQPRAPRQAPVSAPQPVAKEEGDDFPSLTKKTSFGSKTTTSFGKSTYGTRSSPTTEKKKKTTFGKSPITSFESKGLSDDFEIRSTISEISDDFDFSSKFELKKPLTTTKRGPSVRERLAQQKADKAKEEPSIWGSSSSSFWDDRSAELEREEQKRREEDEEEERRRQEQEEWDRLNNVPKERPTGPLGIVLEKVEQWIGSRNNREHLPKNKAKLRSSIKPMCQVKAMGLEPEEAIEKLKEEGYISVATNAEKTVTYLKSKESEKVQYRSNQDSAPKDPAVEALKKCKSWVVEPLNSPKTLDALQNCLKQLCTVKYEFEPEKVVKLLEEHRIITIDNNDKVQYHK